MSADRVRAAYDAVAATYERRFVDELEHKPLDRGLLEAFCGLVPHGVIADVGCGPGHISRYLADRAERVVGVDLSPEMVAIASRRHPGLEFAVASMLDLPYADASLAGVVAMYSIIHLSMAERRRAFGEFARVLRSDGSVLVSFHIDGPDIAPGDVTHLDTFLDQPVDMDGYFLDPALVTTELEDAGFSIRASMHRVPDVAVEYPSRRCYLLACRK